LFAWLANEKTEPPLPEDLATDWFGVRAPSAQQLRIASAVWHGFLLGCSSWPPWDFVGNKTRAHNDVVVLEAWRAQLAKSYPAITAFHDELRAAFFKPVSHLDAHFQLDERAHRLFLNVHVRKLLNRLSALTSMAIEETLPQSVRARFEDFILCDATSKSKHKATLDALVFEKLQAAFPSSNFEFRIEVT